MTYNRIQNQFNKIAKQYNDVALVSRHMAAQLLERLQHIDIAPNTILDLGCGSGELLVELQQQYPQAKLTGIDFSESMLAIAQQKNPNIEFILADITALNLPNYNYDLIIANSVLQWLDPKRFFEVSKVLLAEKGILLFSTVGPDTLIELKQTWLTLDERQHINDFTDMHDLGDMLRELQFVDPVLENQTIHYQIPDVLSLLHILKAMGSSNQAQSHYLRKSILQGLEEQYPAKQQHKLATCEIILGIAKQQDDLKSVYIADQGEVRISVNQLRRRR